MVYVHIADGFEEIEALTVIDLLRRADIPVESVGVCGKEITGSHNIRVICDIEIAQADYDSCRMIVLPGGMPGTVNLMNNEVLSSAIDKFSKEKKYIAAICAAPMILGRKKITDGHKAVIYPGMEEEISGSEISFVPAVTDRNIITGRGPGCAIEFALEIIRALSNEQTASDIAKDLVFKQ